MYLRITGKSKKVSREQIRAAVHFYAHELMPSRLVSLLTISVIFKDGLYEKEDIIGKVTCYAWVLPRKFKILLEPKGTRNSILDTLAHELVHLKQYASGELKDYCYRETTKYRGKYFPFPENDDDKAYWKSPWEKEAHGKEIRLRKSFLKYIDKYGLKSYHK